LINPKEVTMGTHERLILSIIRLSEVSAHLREICATADIKVATDASRRLVAARLQDRGALNGQTCVWKELSTEELDAARSVLTAVVMFRWAGQAVSRSTIEIFINMLAPATPVAMAEA
jgi:hypothetical protein